MNPFLLAIVAVLAIYCAIGFSIGLYVVIFQREVFMAELMKRGMAKLDALVDAGTLSREESQDGKEIRYFTNENSDYDAREWLKKYHEYATFSPKMAFVILTYATFFWLRDILYRSVRKAS